MSGPALRVVDVDCLYKEGDGGQIAIIPPVINVAYRSGGGGGVVAGPAVYRTAITREATRGRRANLVTTSLSVSH